MIHASPARIVRRGPQVAGPPRSGPVRALGIVLCLAASTTPQQAGDGPEGPVERIEVRESIEPLGAALDPIAFATVIHAEDFADRVTNVEELLRESVGVQVASLGGGFATVSIRGSTAEQVVVYLDGIPLNRAIGGGVNLADLPLAQIESIEVYRGFTPASLPSASIGGAVVIRTRGGSMTSGGSGSATFGSFNTAEGSFSYAASRGRSAINVGLDAATTAGDFEFTDNNGTLNSAADEETVQRRNNGIDRLHLTGRFSGRAGDRTRMEVSADLLSRRQGVAGLGNLQSDHARVETERLLIRPEFETAGLLGGHLLVRGAVDYTYRSEAFQDAAGELGQPQESDNRVESFGQEAGFTIVASAHQAISFLASHRRETADLLDQLADPSDLGRASRDTTTLLLEDQIALAGGRLLLNPSVRHERYASDFRIGSAAGTVPEEPTVDASETNGKIGFRLRVSDRLTLKGNYGSFLRLPSFIELYGNRGAVLGNPSLSPESGLSFDAGFAVTGGRPEATFRQARFELIYFETRADDLIVFVPTAQFFVVALNSGRARVRGGELVLSFGLGRRFRGSLNATLQRAEYVTGDHRDGELLRGRPGEELGTRMELAVGRGALFHAFNYVGRNYVDVPNTESLAIPARYLHDVGYRVRLPHGLAVGLEIKNVGNEETLDVARFPLPGRSLLGRLTWEF